MVKIPSNNPRDIREPGGEDPLEKRMAIHPSILTGESHGQGSLAGYGPWSHEESDVTKRLTPSLWTPQEWEVIRLPLCTSLSQRISLFVCNLL